MDNIKSIISNAAASGFNKLKEKYNYELDCVEIQLPKQEEHGDYSTPTSLKLAKQYKLNPIELSEEVTEAITAAGSATEVAAAEFSEKQRERLAKKGHALPDGSFPIRNKQDLKNAVQSWGRAKKSNRAKAKKFIKMRAKQLGASDLIPQNW